MSKPFDYIYVHFLDFYHAKRAIEDQFAQISHVRKEALLAFRLSVLFSETAIIPLSSYFESQLCKYVLRRHPDFISYGAIKVSAADLSIGDHLEAKMDSYDERSPEQLMKAYRRRNRIQVPGYIQKPHSSTLGIRKEWLDVLDRCDPRSIIDPHNLAGLGKEVSSLWTKVPEILGNRAFVPAHVSEIFERSNILVPVQKSFNLVIEPKYIGGYQAAFEAPIIAELPLLTSPFEGRLQGREKLIFGEIVSRLEAFGLLNATREMDSRKLFSLRSNPQWDAVAAAILSNDLTDKGVIERAEFLRRKVDAETSGVSPKSKTGLQMSLPITPAKEVKIGIITALPEEYVAVELLFDSPEEFHCEGDPHKYILGEFGNPGAYKIALMQLSRMRNSSAASGTTNMLRSFPNLQLLVFSGIALGIPNPMKPDKHVRLGDIIVSDRKGVIEIDHNAISSGGTQNRSNLPPPSAAATRAVNELSQLELKGEYPWRVFLNKIISMQGRFARPNIIHDRLFDTSGREILHPNDPGRVVGAPRVFRGSIGSGNTLVKDASYRDEKRNEFDLLAIEMEGAGTAEGAWQFDRPYVVIRSACDYGDPKNDTWHCYAAAAAASYTRSLLERIKLP